MKFRGDLNGGGFCIFTVLIGLGLDPPRIPYKHRNSYTRSTSLVASCHLCSLVPKSSFLMFLMYWIDRPTFGSSLHRNDQFSAERYVSYI